MENDSEKTSLHSSTRRSALMFLAGLSGGAGAMASKFGKELMYHGSALAAVEGIKSKVERSVEEFRGNTGRVHRRAELIEEIFLVSPAPVDVVPANRHRYLPPEISLGAIRTYSVDYFALKAIKAIYESSQAFAVEASQWDVAEGHSIVLTGSAASNSATEDVLGPIPTLGRRAAHGFKARVGLRSYPLPYAMAYLEGPEVSRRENGTVITGPESVVIDEYGRQIAVPDKTREGEITSDILMVTRLPGQNPGTTITIFSGLHGVATRATELLFQSIEASELMKLAAALEVNGNSDAKFFQAVFEARSFIDISGSSHAQEIRISPNCPPVLLNVNH